MNDPQPEGHMASHIERRKFLATLGGAAAAWPLAARAQQLTRRIGMLETIPATANANFDALRNGLRELGYDEGRSLIIEYRSADGRAERFPALAAEAPRVHHAARRRGGCVAARHGRKMVGAAQSDRPKCDASRDPSECRRV